MHKRCNKRFEESFDNVYNHDAFDEVPWYIVAGNKDYLGGGDISFQMNFEGSSRWKFPDHFHTVVREVGEGNDSVKIEIILVDTIQLAGSVHSPRHTKEEENARPSLHQHITDRGFEYIENKLHQSDADYLIVAGHYPPHSIDGLEELMQKHKVSAFVHGHVHCQLHKQHQGIDYFTSGAGMELQCKNQHDSIDESDGKGGFLSFHATADKMVVRYHDQDGKELHQVDVSPRESWDRFGEVIGEVA